MNVQIQIGKKKEAISQTRIPAREGRASTARGEKVREKKEIVEMHEIETDSGGDEFPDNIQLIHSSM